MEKGPSPVEAALEGIRDGWAQDVVQVHFGRLWLLDGVVLGGCWGCCLVVVGGVVWWCSC